MTLDLVWLWLLDFDLDCDLPPEEFLAHFPLAIGDFLMVTERPLLDLDISQNEAF